MIDTLTVAGLFAFKFVCYDDRMIELLIENGADVDLRNDAGRTA